MAKHFLIEVQLIYHIVLVSSVQPSDSDIYIYMYVCVYIYIVVQILFHCSLLQNT